MPKLPRITARQAVRAVRADGWEIVRTSGSHVHLGHAIKPGIVTIAMHPGTMPLGTLRSIVRQAGLTVSQFISLL